MIDLATFITQQDAISKRQYGLQRNIVSAVIDAQGIARALQREPHETRLWADLMLAAVEGALRSGSTPFLVAQALATAQTHLGNQKFLPQLQQAPAPPETINRQAPATFDPVGLGPEVDS